MKTTAAHRTLLPPEKKKKRSDQIKKTELRGKKGKKQSDSLPPAPSLLPSSSPSSFSFLIIKIFWFVFFGLFSFQF